jgi:hypothetical protein
VRRHQQVGEERARLARGWQIDGPAVADDGHRTEQADLGRGAVGLPTAFIELHWHIHGCTHGESHDGWLSWLPSPTNGIWRPTFDVAWRQFVEGNERDVAARLQGGADTAGGFRIQGKEDPGGAEIGLGLRLIPAEANRLRLDLRYQAYVAEHTLENDLVAQATIAF